MFEKILIIFDIANNHQGDVKKGMMIIKEFSQCIKDFPRFDFAIKFQYRQLDSFIHPKYKNNFSFKYIKRFTETQLSNKEYLKLKQYAKSLGFLTGCTPFDEESVDLIVKHKFDFIKVGSCSFDDWPLLEKIVTIDKPVILSTAGADLKTITNAVSLFQNRNKQFALMHCRAEYPTNNENLELNQIDILKKAFPLVKVGYSTHEDPNNFVAGIIAIAKGATVFEKHIDLDCDKRNAYSITHELTWGWLYDLKIAILACGMKERYVPSASEQSSLYDLGRGIWAKKNIKKGKKITDKDIFFAIPITGSQYPSSCISKYSEIIALQNIKKNNPLDLRNANIINSREKIFSIVKKIFHIINRVELALPQIVNLEISHHYGIDMFDTYGAGIISIVNREYCKKYIVLLPYQIHPTHFHKQKEEMFHVLSGSMSICINGINKFLKKGDTALIKRNDNHSFIAEMNGCVFEEISTTHYPNDSFYFNKEILKNKNRKTNIKIDRDLL
jgi:sialic acid synthase SpsE